jgi:hypothetical protein
MLFSCAIGGCLGSYALVRPARLIAIILVSGAGLLPVLAGEAFYLGTWKIASAVEAPWTDPKWKPDPAEMKSLVGKMVVFKANEIAGPRIMVCQGPNYRVVEIPAEGLFQGAFDEMHTRDKSVDPLKLAQKVGFRGTSWKSLQTGCANELDFHFVDPATAEFGLNDVVYTMNKQ